MGLIPLATLWTLLRVISKPMTKKITLKDLSNEPGCLAEYDPNAIKIESAKKLIHSFINPIKATESIKLIDSLNRVLADNLVSPINVPNYDNSAMDGFAYKSNPKDNSKIFKITSTVLAGNISKSSLKNGEAIKIMTGGKIPEGADSVIPIELTTLSGNNITLNELPKTGANIRRVGEDIQKGNVALKKGTYLRPAEIGLIASVGIEKVKVYKEIKIAFFSTGDEVVRLGTAIKSGQVYDSNHHTISAMLQRLGINCIDLGIIPDNKELIKKTLIKSAKTADAIITSGGVSVGQADYMKEVLGELGNVLFWKLSIKPGKPMAYGKIKSASYFGLPGNPVAAMVTFYQLVQPALKYLKGELNYLPPPTIKVKCSVNINKKPGRLEFQRGVLSRGKDGLSVKPTSSQGSAILSSMTEANCFIVLDLESGSIKKGDEVKIQLMNGLI